jgi:hypothetical protein
MEAKLSILNTLINDLPTYVEERLKIIAGKDLTALIRLRVQKGERADGGSFKPYAELTKKIRASKGKQTNFKDFTFTGEMWRNFGEKGTSKSGNEVKITIGGKTSDSEYKISENTEREEFSIIKPSESELALVENILKENIEDFIKQSFA